MLFETLNLCILFGRIDEFIADSYQPWKLINYFTDRVGTILITVSCDTCIDMFLLLPFQAGNSGMKSFIVCQESKLKTFRNIFPSCLVF